MRSLIRAALVVGVLSTTVPTSLAGSFQTNFTGLTPGQDPPNLGPVDFQAPGQVQFFANGPYYVPGSNRAWGFSGQGQANIPFGDFTGGVPSLLSDTANHAAEVSLELRGSRSTDRNNVAGVNFADSQVGLVWYDENNVRWLGGVTVEGAAGTRGDIDNGGGLQEYVLIDNNAYQSVVIDPTAVGVNAVSRVRLVQGVADSNAFALLGDISFTTVPEPSSALLALAGLASCLAGRRQQ